MNAFVESLARWLGDYYLLATVLLVTAVVANWVIAQPARRVAFARATLAGLALLAVLCALPGWSVVHLLSREESAPPSAVPSSPLDTDFSAVESTPDAAPIEVTSLPAASDAPDVFIERSIATRITSTLSAADVIIVVYLCGTLLIVVWQLLGHLRAWTLVRRAVAASPELQRMLGELSGAAARTPPPPSAGEGLGEGGHQRKVTAPTPTLPLGGRARVGAIASHATPRLLISPQLTTAVALGIFRPTILLPQQLVDNSIRNPQSAIRNASTLRMILAHELAHIRHGDLRLLALCRAIFVLLWANPLFWLVRRRLRLDQETLADAAAAQQSTRRQYAEQLVDWAKRFAINRPPALAAAVGLWESPSQLRRRIAVLLDERLTVWRECSRRWRLASLAVCAGVAVGLSLVTLEPGMAEAESGDEKLAAVSKKDSAIENSEPENAKEYTVPITVTGRAIDENDQPIAEAQIYLASPRTNGEPLAVTKTDTQGNYRFEDIPLPIKRPDTNAGKDVGSFELFGIADGYAFAWRPLKWYYPGSDHVQGNGEPTWDMPYSYGRKDPIELDVYFGSRSTLRGRIVNDRGEPIVGATLAIRGGQPSDDNRSLRDLESFNRPSLVPKSVKLRQTDEDGKFEFTALPSDHTFQIDVRPPGYTQRTIYAATRDWTFKDADGVTTHSNDSEIVFARPRKVRFQVVHGDTGKPAPKVGVGGMVLEAGFWETTDNDGMVEVPLPDGTYTLGMSPRYGTPYLKTDTEVVVSEQTFGQITTLRLPSAAMVDIAVVDADTGEPLSGVDVWVEEDVPNSPRPTREVRGYRSWEVETRISQWEQPRTDEHGKMRVLFEPGIHRIGIAHEAFPKGYLPVEIDGQVLELEAGKPVKVEFKMRKVGSSGADATVPKPATTEAAAKPQPNTITGRCVDEQGRPLGGVKVALYRKNVKEKRSSLLGESTTDAKGRFQFENVIDIAKEYPDGVQKPATWENLITVIASVPGRASTYSGEWQSRVAREGMVVELRMPLAVKLTGRVTGPGGEPLAAVRVSTIRMPRFFPNDTGCYSATSDEHGNYEIDDLAPFDYEKERDANATQSRDDSIFRSSIGVPSVTFEHPDFAFKRLQVVKYPATVDAQLQPGATIEGRAVDAEGAPVPAALVQLFTTSSFDGKGPPKELYSAEIRSDAAGKFRFASVPDNIYRIVGFAQPLIARDIEGLKVGIGEKVTAPDLVFIPGATIRIQCIDAETGEPLKLPNKGEAQIILLRTDERGNRVQTSLVGECKEDGTVVVTAPKGEWQVQLVVVARDGGQWRSFTRGREDQVKISAIEGETVEVRVPMHQASAADNSKTDEQQKSTNASRPATEQPNKAGTNAATPNTITGRCVDEQGRALGGVKVAVYEANHRNQTSRKIHEVTSGADGTYRFDNVVNVSQEFPEGLDPNLFTGPVDKLLYVVARAPGRATVYSLGFPRDTALRGRSVELVVPPALTLRGKVLDAEGKPLAGVHVAEMIIGFGSTIPGIRSTTTDANGGYVLNDLEPLAENNEEARPQPGHGATLVTSQQRMIGFHHPDFAGIWLPLTKGKSSLDAKLEPAGNIEGHVRDSNGAPVSGAVVRLRTVEDPVPRGTLPKPVAERLARYHQSATLTDAEGNYRFGSLPTNTYQIRIEAPSLMSRGIDRLEIASGQLITAPETVMTPGGTVRIQFVDAKTQASLSLPTGGTANFIDLGRGRPEILADSAPCSPEGISELRVSPGTYKIAIGNLTTREGQVWGIDEGQFRNVPPVTVEEGQTVEVRLPLRRLGR